MDWTTGRSRFDPRQGQKDFSSNLCVQTGSGAHPTSCPMGTGGPFPEVKSGQGVTLITHPIYCRGQEWVGVTRRLPLRLHRCIVGLLYLFYPRKRTIAYLTLNQNEASLHLERKTVERNIVITPAMKPSIKWSNWITKFSPFFNSAVDATIHRK
jgi:hypothetical protein